MRILIADPEPRPLAQALQAEGFQCETADDADEVLDLAHNYDFDAVIDGLSCTKALRRAGIKTPILSLTAGDLDARLASFRAGADANLPGPFHRVELVAQLNALIRRSHGHAASTIVTGQITVNLDEKRVTVDGRNVHLTGKEYMMLELLSLRKGSTLTKEQFLNHLYGGMDEPELKIIDVFICKLRKKLGEHHHIQTVWGRGYVMTEHEVEPVGVARPLHQRAAPARLRMLQLIAETPRSFRELCDTLDLADITVRTNLPHLIREKFITNVGRQRRAVYQILPVGLEHIKLQELRCAS